jgi:hypothetical protein
VDDGPLDADTASCSTSSTSRASASSRTRTSATRARHPLPARRRRTARRRGARPAAPHAGADRRRQGSRWSRSSCCAAASDDDLRLGRAVGPDRGLRRGHGLPTLNIGRELSPLLFELNRRGAYNGHIPVTAINSAILVVAALLYGHDAIAFSNEHSASSAR